MTRPYRPSNGTEGAPDWVGHPECDWYSPGLVDGKHAWHCLGCGHNSMTRECPLADPGPPKDPWQDELPL